MVSAYCTDIKAILNKKTNVKNNEREIIVIKYWIFHEFYLMTQGLVEAPPHCSQAQHPVRCPRLRSTT